MDRWFLGVDGGQSSTTALIGDARGRVAGHGRGGPCNHVEANEGRAKFIDAIRGCLEQACAAAGINADTVRFEACCLGFSGGPADKEAILREMLRTEHLMVTHDAAIALSGALAGAPGIITIAGTGSMAFGRNAASQVARAGGWGYVFGDEGGGFDIVRQALRAALRSEEGWGDPTALTGRLLSATGAADMNDLLHRFYTTKFPRPRVAALAALVEEAAHAGDEVATRILRRAADDLAIIANAVRRTLFGSAGTDVAYVGGVFRASQVLDRFRAVMERDGNHVQAPLYGPAAGALIEAYRAAGVDHRLSNVSEEK
jgi:N-acetylglucosamine kinase-like BadF-type ATPase